MMQLVHAPQGPQRPGDVGTGRTETECRMRRNSEWNGVCRANPNPAPRLGERVLIYKGVRYVLLG